MSASHEALTAAGGKRWAKSDADPVRYYWNDLPEMLGWTVHRYGTGNISGASRNGEKVSNGTARREMARLDFAKFWYDTATGEFKQRDLSPGEFEAVKAAVLARIEAGSAAQAGAGRKPARNMEGQLWEECERCGQEPSYMPLMLCEGCWPKVSA